MVNFYDLATRIFDSIHNRLNESRLPDLQQKVKDYFGPATSDQMWKKSVCPGEDGIKMWVLNDGTLIWVKDIHADIPVDVMEYSEEEQSRIEGYNWRILADEEFIGTGAIKIFYDMKSKSIEVGVSFGDEITPEQIRSIQELVRLYSSKTLVLWDKEFKLSSYRDVSNILRGEPVKKSQVSQFHESVNEDGAAPAPAPSSPAQSSASHGTTTEDHISYLPARVGEGGRKRRRKFKKLTGDMSMIKEALSNDMKSLRSDLKVELNKLFNGEAFLLLENHFASWKSTFGIQSLRTNKVAVPIEDKRHGIQRIYGQLIREYGNDKGNLEMLISAIQDGRPLGQFEVFNKFDNLFGSRVESKVDGVKVVFEVTIDFIYDPTQTIYIDNPEVLDSVEEQFKNVIKRSKNLLFPVGGKFKIGFYNQLRSIIEDSTNERESEENS